MRFSRQLPVEFMILAICGAALAYFSGTALPPADPIAWSDLFFAEASLFAVWGMIRLLGNMHMFTTVTWSFRNLHRNLRGEKMSADRQKDAYLEYRSSRPHHDDVPFLFICAALWGVLMVIFGNL